MGLCVIEGSGGSDNLEMAKEKWADIQVKYVDKYFNLGNPAGSNTQYRGTFACSMDDVLPENKTLAFAVMISTGCSTSAGGVNVESVTGRNVSVSVGYSYSNQVTITIRGFYIDSGNSSFEIKSAAHYFDVGNPSGSTQRRFDIECSMDSVLPLDAVIIGYGFRQFNLSAATSQLNGIVNRTPTINVGYSYNNQVAFTLIAYYI